MARAAAPLADLADGIAAADSAMALAAGRIELAQRQRAVVQVDIARLTQTIANTDGRIAQLWAEIAEHAVSLYVTPRVDATPSFGSASDLDVVLRRQGLLRSVVRDTTATLDELHGARQDLLALYGQLAANRVQLEGAELVATSAAADLDQSRTGRVELAVTLAERVAALERESAGQERSEGALVRLITASELAAEATAVAEGQAAEAAEEAAAEEETAGAARILGPPLSGPITSEFGTRWGRPHRGVDIDVDIGTPVSAAGPGTVIHAEWMSGYGLEVVVDHGGDLTTVYAHLSEIDVVSGQRVDTGELLGRSGATGDVTGPHLHFETREAGLAVDPRSYLS